MSPEDEEKALQNRIDASQAAVDKEIARITRRGHILNTEDKRFLQARQSYLSKAQLEEFSDVLKEKLPRPDGKEEEAEIQALTRKELEVQAGLVGIENASDKKAYRTNEDLVKAITAAKEEAEKAN